MDANNPFSSSPRPDLDDVFADLTNQDVDAVELMENTHANEALEALDASNGSDRPDSDGEVDNSGAVRDGRAEGSGEGPADEF
jgi:histone demethylase JARID1